MCPLPVTESLGEPRPMVGAPAESAPRSGPEAGLERLLTALSRHLPETEPAGASAEQLLRQTLAWIAAAHGSSQALEFGLSAAETLADLRLGPPALAATLIVAACPPGTLVAAELGEALGPEVAALAEGASRLE